MLERRCGNAAPIWSREDLTQRLGLILIAVSLIIILLIVFLLTFSSRQKRLTSMLMEGRTLAGMVADYSEKTALGSKDAERVLKIMDFLGEKHGLIYSMILDREGRVVFHSDSDQIGIRVSDPVGIRAVTSNNPLHQTYRDPVTRYRIHEFSRPIFKGGRRSGTVRLGFSEGRSPWIQEGDLRQLSLIAILVFLLVPIFYYLVRYSLRPLFSLNHEMQSLLEKNEFRAIPVEQEGELGRLVGRFNQVIAHLRERNDALQLFCEEIEISNSVLTYEKERIELVIDHLQEGVVVVNVTGNVILINREMTLLFGLKQKEVIGRPLTECLEQEEILSWLSEEKFEKGSVTQRNLEISIDRSHGERILRLTSIPLSGSDGKCLGTLIVARDMTARKLSERNQSEFIAHVSHELRTPLTTIKSYVELLSDNDVSDEKTRYEFYNIINGETDRLARLIENLLNISKIEMGSLMVRKDLLKTREFFSDLVESIESQAVNKRISLHTDLPEKMTSLMADKDLLRVAVLNILSNAIKYTPSGGSVTLTAVEEDDFLKVEISDTGYGISEEDLPKIFGKFFRSSDRNIRKETGNGLGLALSKEIVQLHHGELTVSSTIGQGTSFTLILPREEDPRIRGYEGSLDTLVKG